jgi:hypothetical protein
MNYLKNQTFPIKSPLRLKSLFQPIQIDLNNGLFVPDFGDAHFQPLLLVGRQKLEEKAGHGVGHRLQRKQNPCKNFQV